MIEKVIVNLVFISIIATCIYEIYVNHTINKIHKEMRKTNKDLEKQVNQLNKNKIPNPPADESKSNISLTVNMNKEEFAKAVINCVNKLQSESHHIKLHI